MTDHDRYDPRLRPSTTRFPLLALTIGIVFAGAVGPDLAVTAEADTETRQVAPFQAIDFEGSWTVDVTLGSAQSVVIEGDRDQLARVKTSVENGKLIVRTDHGLLSFFGGKTDLTARITAPSLTGFQLQGSGKATITGLDSPDFALEIDGAGDLIAKGKVGKLKVELNGSGAAKLPDLSADEARVTIDGSGDALVRPVDRLDAEINGSGEIRYLGDPPHIVTAIHGSGAVTKQ